MSAFWTFLRLTLAAFVVFGVLPHILILISIMSAGDDGAFVGAILGGSVILFLGSVLGLLFVMTFPIALIVVREFGMSRPLGDVVTAIAANLFVSAFVAFGPAWANPPGVLLILAIGGSVLWSLAAVIYWLLAGLPKPPYQTAAGVADQPDAGSPPH